jgi:hypothetical protein
MRFEDGDRPVWMRAAARKGGWRGFAVTYTKAYLDEQTAMVVDLVREWAAARDHWQPAVNALRSAGADEWLGRAPDEQDHPTLQIQSSRGLPKATPKPKRQKTPKRRA